MENILIIAAGFITAILLGRIIIPNILIISLRKRLFDVPDERKVHKRPIPRLGGVTFFPVIVFTVCTYTAARLLTGQMNLGELSINMISELLFLIAGLTLLYIVGIADDMIGVRYRKKFVVQILSAAGELSINMISELLFLIAGLTLLYIVGIADDMIGVRYRKKFVVQILSAALFPLAGLYINNFYGLFGIYEIPSFIGIPLTMLLVVFITNAINLIDGIDGLASGLSMVALSVFGVIFTHHQEWILALLAFVCVGVIIPFFAYNVFGNADRGRKIFMGDTGSLTLGYILSFFAIQLAFVCVGVIIPFFAYNVFGNADRGRKIFMGDTGSLTLGYILSFFAIQYCMYRGDTPWEAAGSPILTAFSVMMVPCLDVVRVVLKRARQGKGLFLPDRNHIHHKFLNMGFTPRKAMVTIQVMSACFCIFTMLAVHYDINNTLVFIIDVAVWSGLNLWFDKVIKNKKEFQ